MAVAVIDQVELLETWTRAKAAWATLEKLIDVADVPAFLEDALDAVFAVEVRAAVQLRDCGVALPEPSPEDVELARRFWLDWGV